MTDRALIELEREHKEIRLEVTQGKIKWLCSRSDKRIDLKHEIRPHAHPANIRKLGGAIFCDHRYDTIFVYHNGADSYYAARGFRGSLRV